MPITRSELEAKAMELVGAVDETKQAAKDTAMVTGVAIAAAVLGAFILGRRRGSRSKTMVEVYKV